MSLHLGAWDVALVVAVSAQATVLAYLYDPRWKALVWMLPIPFTMASLAVGRPVDATNVLGLPLLWVFTHGVRVLHLRARLPIVAAIVVSTAVYIAGGWLLADIVPEGDTAFWISACAMLLIGWVLQHIEPSRDEPGYRSPLPLRYKLPAIIAVVTTLLFIKRGLAGFTTLFPMVGVIAAYEARYSLHTMARTVPGIMLTLVPLMMVCRLLQERIGLGPALAVGWVVYLVLLTRLTRSTWKPQADSCASQR